MKKNEDSKCSNYFLDFKTSTYLLKRCTLYWIIINVVLYVFYITTTLLFWMQSSSAKVILIVTIVLFVGLVIFSLFVAYYSVWSYVLSNDKYKKITLITMILTLLSIFMGGFILCFLIYFLSKSSFYNYEFEYELKEDDKINVDDNDSIKNGQLLDKTNNLLKLYGEKIITKKEYMECLKKILKNKDI